MSWFLRFFAAILAFFIFRPSDAAVASFAPVNENLRFRFAVISDAHLEGNNGDKHDWMGEAFCDLSAAADPAYEALVMLGDNTMNGQLFEQGMLYGLMRKYCTVDTVLMAVGNHDICGSDYNLANYDRLKKRFIRYNNAFTGQEIDELYHYTVVDGCYFIVLASDRDAGVAQYLSDAQLEWLDGVLREAADGGNPVFLFSHWPLNDVFPDVWAEGHVGEQSDQLKALLQTYDNRIFFFSGHLHMGLYGDERDYKTEGQITYINVPSFGSENTNGGTLQDTGLGYSVEVYEDELVVRVRDLVGHAFTDYEYRFAY